MAIELVISLKSECSKNVYMPLGVGVSQPFSFDIVVDVFGHKLMPCRTVELTPLLQPVEKGNKTGQQRSVKATFPGGNASVTFAWRESNTTWRQVNGVLITYDLTKDTQNPVAQKGAQLYEMAKKTPDQKRIDIATKAIKAAHEITDSFDAEIVLVKNQLTDLEDWRDKHMSTIGKTIKDRDDLQAMFDETEKHILATLATF